MEEKTKEEKAIEEAKNIEADIKKIFAKPIVVPVGEMKFKVVPAPLGELPEISDMVDKYNETLKKNSGSGLSKDTIEVMAELIRMAIQKHHPEWTVELIKKHIPLDYYPDFLDAMTRNDSFLTKMRKLGVVMPVM